MELKMRINRAITSPQILGTFLVDDESKIRIVVEGAGPANTIVVRGRIFNQSGFSDLKTITGAANETVTVFTYEEIEIECTVYDSIGTEVKVLSASFSDAGGSTIEYIDVPSGDTLSDLDHFILTSSDNSVNIVGNNTTKTIDLTASSSNTEYNPEDPAVWNGPPTTVSEGLDELADRTSTLESEISLKIDLSEKGAANGVVPLNSSTKIDSTYLPAYVDDVLEFANLASFPATGSTGVIYIALDTNKTYRWSGSVYIEIAGSSAVWGAITGSLINQTDLQNALDGKANSSHNHNLSAINQSAATTGQVPSWNGTNWVPVTPDPGVTDHGALTGLGDDDHTQYLNDTRGDARYYTKTQIDNTLDASTYYHELHVNFDYTGGGSTGSPFKPFITIQDAVNAAQAQTIGGNTCILIHLKKNITITENVVVNNAVSNLYITASIPSNTDGCPLKIIGNLTITGSQTNRVRVKDIQFAPTSGYALIIDGSNGRHMFQNCQFTNGSLYGQAGTGVNFTGIYKNFTEFVDCTIEGVVNIAGTPSALTTIAMYRCRLGYATVIANAANVSIGMYDTYGIYGITHSAGSLAITGMWGFSPSGFFNSTASLAATSFLSLANMSLQRYDLSFVTFNKTGTCYFQLINVHRNEAVDVLSGVRWVYGPTAADKAYKYAVPANWTSNPMNVATALDQLALRTTSIESNSTNISEILTNTKEPTGFINRTDSTTSFVDGTRIFSISPVASSFSFYIKGVKYTKNTTQNLTIPSNAGNHYIYFNASGNLESTQVFSSSIIEEYAFVAVIYWNSDINLHTYFAEERHGITMDGSTHSYLHTTFGSRYLSGLALQNFTADGNGSLDAHAQFTADAGSIRDEDILLTSLAQTQIPILYRQGQLWRKKAADAFPVIYSGTAGYTGANGRLPYNQYVAGTWQLTQVSSGNYVLVHFFATNDKENPIVGIQGIAEYNNAPQAKAAASSEITSLTGLPFAEFVAIGTVLFQTNAYTNTPDARVVSVNGGNYVDFRGTQLYVPAGTATTHSLLSGLSNDDHIQYHTDARGDIRYYTKTQIDSTVSTLQTDINSRALDSIVIKKDGSVNFTNDQSMAGFKLTNLADPINLTDAVNLQTLNASLGSSGDLIEDSFSMANNQSTSADVDLFKFTNGITRSFSALVSVYVNATTSLYEVFEINGIQKSSDWFISITSEGDSSGVTFTITNSGQIQYTNSNYSGFISGVINFRAITTSV